MTLGAQRTFGEGGWGYSHTCTSCGATFSSKRVDARYCSPACRQDAKRRREGVRRSRRNPRRRGREGRDP